MTESWQPSTCQRCMLRRKLDASRVPNMADHPMPQLRNLRFQVGGTIPRHWHGGRRAITLFFNNLSILFPAGERFFIASVRAHADRVEDDVLKRQMRAFCAQEGVHGREHTRYNRMLADQGYPIAALERRVEARLRRTSRWASPRRRLAVTCALEHFTAVMGRTLLSDRRLLQGADPEMAALWRWHAIEETEHKAVAFDVYQAAGGGYLARTASMSVTTLVFWSQIVLSQIVLMRADGCLFSFREWRSLVRFLFVEPGGMFNVALRWLDYYRPSFHPWDCDDRPLLEGWVRELEARAGSSVAQ
jgi:predicted metal-dependent hydrolase